MKNKLSLPLLFVSCWAVVTFATNPGLKLRLTQKGLDYVRQVAQVVLNKELQTLNSIPDSNGGHGDTRYSLTGIRKTGMHPPTCSMSFNPGSNSLTLGLSNMAINLRGDWRYQKKIWFFMVRDSGSITADVNGLGLTVSIRLGKASDGRPLLSTASCRAHIGGVNLKVHGTWISWLYNMFMGHVERKVKSLLVPRMCKLVTKAINVDANKALAQVNLNETVAKDFLLDYRLVNKPKVSDKFLELEHKAEVFWAKDIKEAPFSPAPMPGSDDDSRMVNLWLSDYTVNSYVYNAFTHEFFRHQITLHDLPADKRLFLRTSCPGICAGTIFPKLAKMYPNKVLNFSLHAPVAPTLSISTNGATVRAKADIDLFTQGANDQTDTFFTLEMELTFTALVRLENQRLTAQIVGHNFTTSVKRTTIGTIDPKYTGYFDKLVHMLIDVAITRKANEYGREGIALPLSDDVTLTNANIKLLNGALLLSSDVIYTPK